MFKLTQFRSNQRRRKYARALVLCAAASALLLARNTSPQFSGTSAVHSVMAEAHHDQRPRFDNSGYSWYQTNAAFVLSPPAELHAHLNRAAMLLFSLPAKGAHYNRPPPLL